MTTAVTSSPAPQGHCSQCGKVWTLKERQGVCRWCGNSASCQSTTAKPRHIKSRSNGRRKQADHNGNGYDQLTEPYLTYYNVASRFAHKAMTDDQEDLLHDIILHLAVVERNSGHKPFTEAAMYRTASHVKDHYWYSHYKLTMGLDCQHCSKAQRAKCRKDWLYPECPKAITLESLNKPVIDSEGNLTELGELIADDKALDLDAWVDTRTFLIGAPQRLKLIAWKLEHDEQLTGAEKVHLHKWRKREQKSLF